LVGSASYIDSLIINFKYDNATFAIFRYGAREFPFFLLIANAFGTSMVPQFSNKEKLHQNLEVIKAKSKKMMQLSFPIALVLLLTSQYLFTLVFNKNFHESYKVFDIYLLLIISRFLFPQTVLLGLKKNQLLLQISVVELCINVISSLVLLHYFGYLGVAYGTIIAYFSEKVMLTLMLKDKFQIKAKRYVNLQYLIFFSIILIAVFVVKSILLNGLM
jgi:O-antigen/teichoic acid export membrane protein